MKPAYPSLLLLGILLVLSGCFFTDPQMYDVTPQAGEKPTVTFTVNLDTIAQPVVVFDSLEIRYDAVVEGGELYFVEAGTSTTYVFDSDSLSNRFWIKPDQGGPGIDSLYLYFYYSTNTNSLADILEIEAFYARRSYGLNFESGGKK
ncbi:MAG: hypothetical protein R2751_02165 [Bacteroidales bacterium]